MVGDSKQWRVMMKSMNKLGLLGWLEQRETKSIQKSILEDDDHCKPYTGLELVVFGIICALVVGVILWLR